MSKINQNGAIDFMLVAVLIIVLAVGGFIYWRITSAQEATYVDSQVIVPENEEKEKEPPVEEVIPEGFSTFVLGDTGVEIVYPKSENPIEKSQYQQQGQTWYSTKNFGLGIARAEGYSFSETIGIPSMCNYDKASNKFKPDADNTRTDCLFEKRTVEGVEFLDTSTGYEGRTVNSYKAPIQDEKWLLSISLTHDSECYGGRSTQAECDKAAQKAKDMFDAFIDDFAANNKTLFN